MSHMPTTESVISPGTLTNIVNAYDYGAAGDGRDSTAALQSALAAAAAMSGGGVGIQGATVFVPSGVHLISSALELPYNISITLDPQATIKATAAMTAMLHQADNTSPMRENLIEGGVWDANSLATDVIWFRCARGVRVQNTTLMNIKGTGIHFGDLAAANTSYGLYTENVAIWRLSGVGTVVVGSIGIFLEAGSGDSMIRTAQIVGVETGIKLNSGNNRVIGAHAWSFASTGWTKVAFEDNGNGNVWVGAYADTPSETGFLLSGQNTVMLGCKIYNNSIYGTDNTVVGIRFTQPNPTRQFATIVGTHFDGAGVSHRLAKDFDAWDTTGIDVFGNQITNVVDATFGSSVGTLKGVFLTSTDTLTANKRVILDAAAGGSNRRVDVRTSGSTRWSLGGDNAAEAGANAGSNFLLGAYDDTGTLIRTDAFVRRTDGQWTFAGAAVITGGVFIGAGGTKLTQTKVYTPNLTPAAVAANTTAEQTFAVAGLTAADTVHLNPPAGGPDGTGIVGVRVSAADTLAIRFANNTAGALTPAPGTYRVVAIRS